MLLTYSRSLCPCINQVNLTTSSVSTYAYCSLTETLIKTVIDGLLLSKEGSVQTFTRVALSQPRSSKKVIHLLLHHLSRKYLNHLTLDDDSPDDNVSAVAGLLKELALNDQFRRDTLIEWCASSSGAGLGDGVGIRRAVIATLSQDREAITSVLEKSLAQFGDELYIRHSAILQQDGKGCPNISGM